VAERVASVSNIFVKMLIPHGAGAHSECARLKLFDSPPPSESNGSIEGKKRKRKRNRQSIAEPVGIEFRLQEVAKRFGN
jgi:hypothetical protein